MTIADDIEGMKAQIAAAKDGAIGSLNTGLDAARADLDSQIGAMVSLINTTQEHLYHLQMVRGNLGAFDPQAKPVAQP